MASSRAKKLSISLPTSLANQLKKRAGARGVSAFAARAIREELIREEKRRVRAEFLAELDDKLGPVPEADIEEVRALWRKVSS
jgi:hypothetical protein